MNLVKVISTELSDLSQRVVKYLRFGRYDVQTSVEAMPYGTDANPIKDMVAVYAETAEKGRTVIVGYLNKSQIADVGEHRIFSTNADGVVQTYIHLKKDGIMEVGGNSDFMVRYSELATAYNQLKDDHDATVGKLNAIISVLQNWTVVPNDGGGALKIAAAALIDASDSTGDISNAKIDEIKTI